MPDEPIIDPTYLSAVRDGWLIHPEHFDELVARLADDSLAAFCMRGAPKIDPFHQALPWSAYDGE